MFTNRMMTSSNGNIFRVTGLLCREFTAPGEFPSQRPVTRSFDAFFDLCQNKQVSKQSRDWWSETPSSSLWRQCNGFEKQSITACHKLHIGGVVCYRHTGIQLLPVIHCRRGKTLYSLCNPRDHCTHSLFQDCCIVKLVTSNHPTYLHRGTTLRWGIVLYALVRKTMHGVIVGKGVRTRRLSDRYCTCVWMSEMFWCDQ